MEVGSGLEPILTDAFSNQVIEDTIIPRFKAGDFPGGIAAGTDALITQLQAPPEAAERAAVEAAQKQAQASPTQRSRGGAGFFPIVFFGPVRLDIIFFIVLPVVFVDLEFFFYNSF